MPKRMKGTRGGGRGVGDEVGGERHAMNWKGGRGERCLPFQGVPGYFFFFFFFFLQQTQVFECMLTLDVLLVCDCAPTQGCACAGISSA